MRRFIPIHRWLKFRWRRDECIPEVGRVQFGHLRRVTPISRDFGFDRGLPIDRYYIEHFLARHSGDIRGHVLEIGDNSYTRKFGLDRVTQSDVLHSVEGNPNATIVGDLANAPQILSDRFDCFILTQTLQYVYDVRSAVKTIYRILKPGGIVLSTLPCITSLSDPNWNDCWYWGFTSVSAKQLFEEIFPPANVEIETYGNVLAATAFLQGLATKELDRAELDYHDPSYQVLITVRAAKPKEKA